MAKVTFKTAAEVAKHFPLGDDAKKLAKDGQTPKQLIDALAEKKLWQDAIKLLAYSLPKREGVWWACLSARQAHGGTNVPPKVAAAMQAAEKWCVDPKEDHRRATLPLAEAAELKTAAGCAAIAAFWSGGSLGPADGAVVAPGELLTAHGVASAVLMAASVDGPDKAPDKYKKLLALGLEVADGKNQWK